RYPVKAETVSALDGNIKKFADPILRRLENDDFVGSGAAHQTSSVCFARAFTQNFDASSDQFFIRTPSRGVNYPQQVLITHLLCCLVDLIRHGRSGRFAPRGIAKDESIIELEVFDEIAGCFVIGIGLAREADDDVARQCDPWAGGT